MKAKVTNIIALAIVVCAVSGPISSIRAIGYVNADSSLELVALGRNLWNLSCHLTEGDYVRFVFREGLNWAAEGYFESDNSFPGFPVLYVTIKVAPIDRPTDATVFMSVLTPHESQLLTLTTLLVQNGSIDTSSTVHINGTKDDLVRFNTAGGTVLFGGTYSLEVKAWPPRISPPSFLGVYHNATVQRHVTSGSGDSQFEPTAEVFCQTGGDILLMNSGFSFKVLNDTALLVHFQTDFQSGGVGPTIYFSVSYQVLPGGELSSFDAHNASVDISGYMVTWTDTPIFNHTSAVIRESYSYSYYGVGGSWGSEMTNDVSVAYQVELQGIVDKAQLTLTELHPIPIVTSHLLVVGELELDIVIRGGISRQGDTCFLGLGLRQQSNSTAASLAVMLPEDAGVIFNSENLGRLRPNVLLGSTSFEPYTNSELRSYVQYEILPWYRRFPWNEIVFPGAWTLFGIFLTLIVEQALKRFRKKAD